MDGGDYPNDPVTAKEAARLVRVDLVTVHRWRLKGLLRGWRRVGRWVFERAEVLGMMRPVRTVPAEGAGPRRGKRAAEEARERWREEVRRRNGLA